MGLQFGSARQAVDAIDCDVLLADRDLGRPSMVLGFGAENRLVGLRLLDGPIDDCTVDEDTTAHALVMVAGGLLLDGPLAAADGLEAADSINLDDLAVVLGGQAGGLVGQLNEPGTRELVSSLAEPLRQLTQGTPPSDPSSVYAIEFAQLPLADPGVRLSGTLSAGPEAPHEIATFAIDGSEVAWLRPDDYPARLADLLSGQGFLNAPSAQAGFELPLINVMPPDGLIVTRTLRQPELSSLAGQEPLVASGLESALHLLHPDLIGPYGACPQSEACCDALRTWSSDAVEQFAQQVLPQPAWVAMLDSMLAAAYEGPDQETGWLVACENAAAPTAARQGEIAAAAAVGMEFARLVELLLPETARHRWLTPWTDGASITSGELDLCSLTPCGDAACVWTAEGLACTDNVPAFELHCDDLQDDDADGAIDCDDPDCAGTPSCPESLETNCYDGLDEDIDGLIDCSDPDCATAPPCLPIGVELVCFDGIDNDADSATDCDDPDCAFNPLCIGTPPVEPVCNNGIDDDNDGMIDCDDPDCAGNVPCVPWGEVCDDGIDNDGDGLIDCDAPACACTPPVESSCNNAIDDDLDGAADCADSDCVGDPSCVAGTEYDCADGLDGDGDGDIDCDDIDCSLLPGCSPAPVETCVNGIDDDSDGALDCEDEDCLCVPGRYCGDDAVVWALPDSTASDDLTASDAPPLPSRSPAHYQDDLEFQGIAGQQVVFEGLSADFDLYLMLLDEGCRTLAEDNGSPGGLPQVVFTLPETGVYTAVVTSFAAGETGSYTVHLATWTGAGAEVCDDQIDNDGDGAVDCDDSDCPTSCHCPLLPGEPGYCLDTCPCGAGLGGCMSDSDCLPGLVCTAFSGTDYGYPPSLGVCEIPPEDCTNGIDDDLDSLEDCLDPDCFANSECIPEICTNNIDDDGDGHIDCDDDECLSEPVCIDEICGNNIDDDGDGHVDCDDFDCSEVCAEACNDAIDNDADSLIDCADPECATGPPCIDEICTNGIDDDGDDLADCLDPQCEASCAEICDDNIDNDADNLIDCADDECGNYPACTPEICGNTIDDDGDGDVDCDDFDCTAACSEICDDNIDNDADNLIDCDDSECASDPTCTATCGDGVINQPSELCDGADMGSVSCSSLGWDGGTPSCSTSCTPQATGCWGVNLVSPSLGQWSPQFAAVGSCVCGADTPSYNPSCHRLYVVRCDAVRGYDNEMDISVTKTAWAGGPSAPVDAWIGVNDVVPACDNIDDMVARLLGPTEYTVTWSPSQDELHLTAVPVWPTMGDLEAANCGATKSFAAITGGGDAPSTRTWYSADTVDFIKSCAP